MPRVMGPCIADAICFAFNAFMVLEAAGSCRGKEFLLQATTVFMQRLR